MNFPCVVVNVLIWFWFIVFVDGLIVGCHAASDIAAAATFATIYSIRLVAAHWLGLLTDHIIIADEPLNLTRENMMKSHEMRASSSLFLCHQASSDVSLCKTQVSKMIP